MTPEISQLIANRPRRFWALLALMMVVFSFYLYAGLMIFRYGGLVKDFGWESAGKGSQYYISKVDYQGVAADKLQPGDQLISINGERLLGANIGNATLWVKLRAIEPGRAYQIKVKRGGQEYQFSLTAQIKQDNRNLPSIATFLFISLAFYITGMLVGMLKPGEQISQLVSLSLMLDAGPILSVGLAPMRYFFQGWEWVFFFILFLINPFHLAVGYHVYYRLPVGVPKGKLWSAIKYLLYGWSAILLLLARWQDFSALFGRPMAETMQFSDGLLQLLGSMEGIFALTAFVAMCSVIIRNYLIVNEPDQRRRIRWIAFGSVMGLSPILLLTLANTLLIRIGFGNLLFTSTFTRLMLLGNIALIIIPFSFSYAVVKHRVLDINVVVRRGVQYLLAKQVLRIMLFLPVTGLIYAILTNPNLTVKEILFQNSIYFYLFVTTALSFIFRRRLRESIDRLFFQEAYNQEKLLMELIEEIKHLDSMSEISKLISHQLDSAIHPKSIYIFYREEEKEDLTLGHSTRKILLQTNRLSASSQFLHSLESQRIKQEFSVSEKFAELPADERAWFNELGVDLIVPMIGTDERLVGLLMLGEKRSEQPYTTADRKLLQTLAGQMAVLCENALLRGRVGKEEKINREMLARFAEQNIDIVKECSKCGLCYSSNVEICLKDQTELKVTLPVERIIAEKYQLDRLIGKGGMGAVYQATDTRLSRKVAIKVMVGNTFDQEAMRRFEREAQASARLNHPNLIAVHDFGPLRTGGAYLVMELMNGVTLATEIQRSGRLSPKQLADLLEQLLDGVAAAHQAGVIHRDLKPSNILLTNPKEGQTQLKILDFGIAKLQQNEIADTDLTLPGTILGTFGYMSPEQISGETVDERSDIFSIGVIVVEGLTGRRPFQGKTLSELLLAMVNQPFHLRGNSQEVKRLDQALQKCLAKSRKERFKSVTALRQELIPALRACPNLTASLSFGDTGGLEPETVKLPRPPA